ncbi:MAG: hypothetical protein IT200_18285 [Thermoleophilia bacterium]|nr:hypothetical protein [Thermoleophilia bacterium]
MTPIPDQLRQLDPSELRALPARRLRGLISSARRERQAIQQEAVAQWADTRLGQRLSDVDALERACRCELSRRGRFRSLRRVLVTARLHAPG